MLRKKWVPDAFYFPQGFIAGVLISFISVMYMSLTILNYLVDLKTSL